VRAVGRHEELWGLAEYRAAFGEGTGSADEDAERGVPA
jgi:ATP-binding cassette subfamily B protein